LQNTLFSTRTLVSLFSGAVAGVIGLENLWGFAFYVLTLVLHAVVVAGLRCGGKPKDYYQHGWWDLLSVDQDGFLAFLLLWIGTYAVVHGELKVSIRARSPPLWALYLMLSRA
jgi:hypothetical protein